MQVCATRKAFHAHFFAHCLRKHKKIWQHSSSVIQKKGDTTLLTALKKGKIKAVKRAYYIFTA